jgi:CRP-like cAMP-binding protein
VADAATRHWLDWMAAPTRDALLAYGTLREFPPDDVLIRQDEVPTAAMIIQEGLVAVSRLGHDGERVFLTFRGPCELLGEIGVLDNRPRVADVRALNAPVRVLWYETRHFRAFLDSHPDALKAAQRAMVGKHLVHQERRTRYTRGHTVCRVAHILLDFASDFGMADGDGRVVIDVPLNQQRIADLAGVGPDGVWSAVRRLKQKQIISTSAGPASRMRIEDQAALIEAATVRP